MGIASTRNMTRKSAIDKLADFMTQKAKLRINGLTNKEIEDLLDEFDRELDGGFTNYIIVPEGGDYI